MRPMDAILEDAERLFDFLADTKAPSQPADIILAMGGSDLRVADTAAQAFLEKRAGYQYAIFTYKFRFIYPSI